MQLACPITAKYATYIPEFPAQERTAAQRAGISFERAVVRRLKALHNKVEPGPWLYYQAGKQSGICQPDALVWLSDDHLLVVEAKLSWVRSARKKLMEFYRPIVAAIYPKATLSCLQIYKNTNKAAHKKPVSIYELGKIPANKYRECQWLGI